MLWPVVCRKLMPAKPGNGRARFTFPSATTSAGCGWLMSTFWMSWVPFEPAYPMSMTPRA